MFWRGELAGQAQSGHKTKGKLLQKGPEWPLEQPWTLNSNGRQRWANLCVLNSTDEYLTSWGTSVRLGLGETRPGTLRAWDRLFTDGPAFVLLQLCPVIQQAFDDMYSDFLKLATGKGSAVSTVFSLSSGLDFRPHLYPGEATPSCLISALGPEPAHSTC